MFRKCSVSAAVLGVALSFVPATTVFAHHNDAREDVHEQRREQHRTVNAEERAERRGFHNQYRHEWRESRASPRFERREFRHNLHAQNAHFRQEEALERVRERDRRDDAHERFHDWDHWR